MVQLGHPEDWVEFRQGIVLCPVCRRSLDKWTIEPGWFVRIRRCRDGRPATGHSMIHRSCKARLEWITRQDTPQAA